MPLKWGFFSLFFRCVCKMPKFLWVWHTYIELDGKGKHVHCLLVGANDANEFNESFSSAPQSIQLHHKCCNLNGTTASYSINSYKSGAYIFVNPLYIYAIGVVNGIDWGVSGSRFSCKAKCSSFRSRWSVSLSGISHDFWVWWHQKVL